MAEKVLGNSHYKPYDSPLHRAIFTLSVCVCAQFFFAGVAPNACLEEFGKYLFRCHWKTSKHANLLGVIGHDLYSFIINLDALHTHLSSTYPKMDAPSFRCKKTPCGLLLHYYSHRKGLENVVKGIIEAVAIDFFRLEVSVTPVDYQKTHLHLCHHYTLSVELKMVDMSKLERKSRAHSCSL